MPGGCQLQTNLPAQPSRYAGNEAQGHVTAVTPVECSAHTWPLPAPGTPLQLSPSGSSHRHNRYCQDATCLPQEVSWGL